MTVKGGQAGGDARSLVSAICRRLAQAVVFCRLEGRLQDVRGESSAGRAFGRSQTLKDNVCAGPPTATALLSRNDAAHVLEQNKQMHRIDRGRNEIEVFIETSGILILCMNREGTNSGNIGGLQGTLHGVSKQCLADSLTLPTSIHPQTGEEHDRYRMPRETLGQPAWRLFLGHLTHSKSVKADDGIIDNADVGLRSSCLLVLPGMAQKIPIQVVVAAIEALDWVVAA